MPSDLEKNFEYCKNYIQNSKPGAMEINNEQKLIFYALFKQATVGNCTGKRPGMTQIVARYKYDSWKKLSKQGMTKEKAMETFIEEFKKLAPADVKAKL